MRPRARTCWSFGAIATLATSRSTRCAGVSSRTGARIPRAGASRSTLKSETVVTLPMFRETYARRRCILPVDGFFEWKAIKGTKAKQPFAIAMRDGWPFGIAGVWENWRDPAGEWQRTFAVITVPSNELVGQIHDRMPAILRPEEYDRSLGEEPDPRDLLHSYQAELMRVWPISTRVNKPEN